jgi:hypothetical protein
LRIGLPVMRMLYGSFILRHVTGVSGYKSSSLDRLGIVGRRILDLALVGSV